MPKTSGNSTYSPDSPNSPKQPQQPSLAIFRQVFRCLLETREEPDSGGVVMPQCVYWASQLPSEIKSHFFDEGLDFRGRFFYFFSWLDSNLFFVLAWFDVPFFVPSLFVAKLYNFVYDMFACVCWLYWYLRWWWFFKSVCACVCILVFMVVDFSGNLSLCVSLPKNSHDVTDWLIPIQS